MFPTNSTQIILPIFGVIFTGLGLAACLGYWKKWYWQTHGAVYGYIPLGFLFILFAVYQSGNPVFAAYPWLFPTIFALFAAIVVWWSIRPPGFLKPSWIRWVEKHPKGVVEAMRAAVKDQADWSTHLTSQAAVDSWAKSLGGSKNGKKKSGAKGVPGKA